MLRKPPTPTPARSNAEIAALEAANALRQYDHGIHIIEEALKAGVPFELRPSHLLALNRLAIEGVDEEPGKYRSIRVSIRNSSHEPPPPAHVPRLVEQMCSYANRAEHSPFHAAAFIMWRLNWIHPFRNGNGRTSRIASYIMLSTRLGFLLPGSLTIPKQIADEKPIYYGALDDADAAWKQGRIDLSRMEDVIANLLEIQLDSATSQASESRSQSTPLNGSASEA